MNKEAKLIYESLFLKCKIIIIESFPMKSTAHIQLWIQYIPQTMHADSLCFVLLWLYYQLRDLFTLIH